MTTVAPREQQHHSGFEPPLEKNLHAETAAMKSGAADMTLKRLAILHFRVGNMTFGGGDPTLAALHSELVGVRKWITVDQYGLVFALARITPGTNLLAFCAGISWELLGWTGAVVSVLAITVPAAILVVLLSHGYMTFASNRLAMATVGGVLAAAVGMMPAAAWQLARPYMKASRRIYAVVIAGSAMLLHRWIGLSPVTVLGLAVLVGLVWKVRE